MMLTQLWCKLVGHRRFVEPVVVVGRADGSAYVEQWSAPKCRRCGEPMP